MEENKVIDPDLVPGNVADDEDEFHHVNNPVTGLKPIVKKYLSRPVSAEQKK